MDLERRDALRRTSAARAGSGGGDDPADAVDATPRLVIRADEPTAVLVDAAVAMVADPAADAIAAGLRS